MLPVRYGRDAEHGELQAIPISFRDTEIPTPAITVDLILDRGKDRTDSTDRLHCRSSDFFEPRFSESVSNPPEFS